MVEPTLSPPRVAPKSLIRKIVLATAVVLCALLSVTAVGHICFARIADSAERIGGIESRGLTAAYQAALLAAECLQGPELPPAATVARLSTALAALAEIELPESERKEVLTAADELAAYRRAAAGASGVLAADARTLARGRMARIQKSLAAVADGCARRLDAEQASLRQLIGTQTRMVNARLIIAVLVCLAIAMALAQHVAHRLRHLVEAARQMSAGKFDLALSDRSGDELGALTTCLNDLAGRLAQSTEQRSSTNDRRLLAGLVEEAGNVLDRIEAQQAVLCGRCADAAQMTELQEAACRFSEIVDDLRDLQQLRESKASLHRMSCSPGQLVGEIAYLMQRQCTARGWTIAAEAPADAASIETDPVRLRRVLSNLVTLVSSNPAGGRIRLVAAAEGGQARFRVLAERAAGAAATSVEGNVRLLLSKAICQSLGGKFDTGTAAGGEAFTVSVAAKSPELVAAS